MTQAQARSQAFAKQAYNACLCFLSPHRNRSCSAAGTTSDTMRAQVVHGMPHSPPQR